MLSIHVPDHIHKHWADNKDRFWEKLQNDYPCVKIYTFEKYDENTQILKLKTDGIKNN